MFNLKHKCFHMFTKTMSIKFKIIHIMNHSQLLVVLLFPIFLHYLASPTTAQADFVDYGCVDDFGNYTANSTYRANLHKLLSAITSNQKVDYGFYNFSVGENMDRVHGVGLCRGDISTSNCRNCLDQAAARITKDCPNQMEAVGWYEDCMIWYSNQNIFKGVSFDLRSNISSSRYAPNKRSFNETASTLMTRLATQAALGDTRRKFATGEANVSNTIKIYALLQCVPDLQEFDCFNCLTLVIRFTLAKCCYGKLGAQVAVPSCNIRFENYKFYNSATLLPPLVSPLPPPPISLSLPPSSSNTSRTGKKNKKLGVVITILLASIIAVLAVFLACCFLIKTRKTSKKAVSNEDGEVISKVESLQMDFGTIKAATDKFSDTNKIGQGGFGAVYKGTLPSGQVVAVKRLSKNSGQGEKEFKNEALLVAKLQHRNLVRFLGFCLKKAERILIYELLPNKSLDYFLFDPIKRKDLDWQKRYNIIGGIARGLLYLHEESRLLVVHRDLKASNILLDTEMNPKISDFGMARLFETDQSHANTNRIAGTYGYMPPEYVLHGQFSIKSDVFSFGVLVLEIISGQRVSKFSQAESGESLLSFAWRSWLEGNALSLVDPTMSFVDNAEVLRCINIGLLCVQENAAQRPIMSSVVLMLNSFSVTLPVPSRPAFLIQNNKDSDPPSLEHNRRPLYGSINAVSLTDLAPR